MHFVRLLRPACEKPLRVFASCALFVLAIGCGPNHATDNGENTFLPVENPRQREDLLNSGVVSCADLNHCNESAGMILIAQPEGVFVCSGFLVSGDIFATNSHCFKKFYSKGNSCVGKANVYFPRTQRLEASKIGCGEILDISTSEVPGNYADIDYAFIRLAQPSGRPGVAVSVDGMPDSMAVKIVKMTPVPRVYVTDPPTGVIGEETCKIVQNTILFPQFDANKRSVATFSGCNVVHGNSGSLVLNPLNQAVGILEGEDKLPFKLARMEKGVGFATNLACITNPLDPTRGIPQECSTDLTSKKTAELRLAKQAAAFEKFMVGLNERVNKEAEGVLPVFQWELRNVKLDSLEEFLINILGPPRAEFLPIPTCVRSDDRNLESYKRGLLWGYKKDAEVDLSLPLVDVQIGYDDRFQPQYKVSVAGEKQMRLQFFPSDIHETRTSRTILTQPSLLVFRETVMDKVLPSCP